MQNLNKNITIVNKKTICFTGHRPKSLPWGKNEDDERCIQLKLILKKKLIEFIENGFDTFLCGMALGFDTICVEILLSANKNNWCIALFKSIL